MNKFLMFPMTFMIICAIFAILAGNIRFVSVLTGQGASDVSTEKTDFDLQNTYTIVGLLALAFSVAGVTGFNILGSGFTQFTQKLIFVATLYGGIWAALSITNSLIMFSDNFQIAPLLWSLLTIIYIIGMGVEVDTTV